MGRASRRKRDAANSAPSSLPPVQALANSQRKYGRVAPCCGRTIYPGLRAYYIKNNAYHQYRCESCGKWLTFESDTKLEAAAFSLLSVGAIFSLAILVAGELFHDPIVRVIVFVATIAVGLAGWYGLLAIYLRSCATWIVQKR